MSYFFLCPLKSAQKSLCTIKQLFGFRDCTENITNYFDKVDCGVFSVFFTAVSMIQRGILCISLVIIMGLSVCCVSEEKKCLLKI